MQEKFLSLSFGSLPFRECVHVPVFRYQYFAAYRFGFKVFNHIGTRRCFQLVEEKKCFAKKVAEGLGTGSFVTVTNATPHSFGSEEILPGKVFLIT